MRKLLTACFFALIVEIISISGAYAASTVLMNFSPLTTKEITPTTSTQRVTFSDLRGTPDDPTDIMVTNNTDKLVRVNVGSSSVTATDADGPSWPVAPGAIILVSKYGNSVAVISTASPTSGKVYITTGSGN